MNKYGLISIAALMMLGACSSLLPHEEKITDRQWEHFEDVKSAYDQVIPYESTLEDLDRLGFTPEHQANVEILNYIETLDRVVPDDVYDMDDLPMGIQDCASAGAACNAYEFEQRSIQYKRYGNFFADFLNFNRKIETTGWKFNAIFVIAEDRVVYKVWSGMPDIHEYSEETNPLGPLQGIGPSISESVVD